MKKYRDCLIIFLLGFILAGCSCKDYCSAAKKAGFDFSLKVKNPQIKAKKGEIEVGFIYKGKSITITKTDKCKTKEDKDGVCIIKNKANEKYFLLNCVPFNIYKKEGNIVIANFTASSGYYSITCQEGFSKTELLYFYHLIEEVETIKQNPE